MGAHKGFAAGDVDTGLIARDIDELTAVATIAPSHWACAGIAALGLDTPKTDAGFSLWAPLRQSVALACEGGEITLQVEVLSADAQRWFVGDAVVEAKRIGGRWQLDGKSAPQVAVAENRITVFDAYGIAFDVVDPLQRDASASGDGNVVEAPMPGLVKAVTAKAGQVVQAGDRLAVLEAMKMEHALLAARDGVIAEVLVSEGDQVEAGAALIRLEDAEV